AGRIVRRGLVFRPGGVEAHHAGRAKPRGREGHGEGAALAHPDRPDDREHRPRRLLGAPPRLAQRADDGQSAPVHPGDLAAVEFHVQVVDPEGPRRGEEVLHGLDAFLAAERDAPGGAGHGGQRRRDRPPAPRAPEDDAGVGGRRAEHHLPVLAGVEADPRQPRRRGDRSLPGRLHRRALPATNTAAAMATSSPICTLCAMWTRLSSLVPRPIRVTPSMARSTVVLAPISTSSSMTTRPIWGMWMCRRSASCAYPNPSLPTTAPLCTTTRAPRRLPRRIVACAWRMLSGPIWTSSSMTTWACACTRSPSVTSFPTTTYGPREHSAPTVTRAPRTQVGWMPAGGAVRGARARRARASASRTLATRIAGRRVGGASWGRITAA